VRRGQGVREKILAKRIQDQKIGKPEEGEWGQGLRGANKDQKKEGVEKRGRARARASKTQLTGNCALTPRLLELTSKREVAPLTNKANYPARKSVIYLG
jgi:hypothetical protein